MNKKIFDVKIFAIVSAVAIASFASIILLNDGEAESFTYDGIARAAIIDQLYEDIPNERFHTTATEYLEAAGYQVDIFTTKDITVDFYKQLPKMNYKYVVVRTHGAEDASSNDSVLFTGERYQEDKYIQEQLFGQVKRATPLLELAFESIDGDGSTDWIIVNDSYKYKKTPVKRTETTQNEFFAISPKLISEGMDKKFLGTIFVLGGCNTLSHPSIAESFIKRGASLVVGWDNTVGNYDNDRAMLMFLQSTLVDNLEVEESLEMIQETIIPEKMAWPANLIYYDSV